MPHRKTITSWTAIMALIAVLLLGSALHDWPKRATANEGQGRSIVIVNEQEQIRMLEDMALHD